jgi:hypothetical protein
MASWPLRGLQMGAQARNVRYAQEIRWNGEDVRAAHATYH